MSRPQVRVSSPVRRFFSASWPLFIGQRRLGVVPRRQADEFDSDLPEDWFGLGDIRILRDPVPGRRTACARRLPFDGIRGGRVGWTREVEHAGGARCANHGAVAGLHPALLVAHVL